ncbi:hypothetical protein [Bradyrhizobium sp.]|jgi:hypothetical protein|uniref:hypothetical protein n=1 Tax=Bradyrhizobium sp. TaxID=376 RepID=UPI003D0E8533
MFAFFLACEGTPVDSPYLPACCQGIPQRVRQRPDPAQWREDEFMSFREAASLFWPDGPIKPASLRTAQRDGQLAVARIAGKVLTTRSAIEAMVKEALRASPGVRRAKAAPRLTRPSGRSEIRAQIEALVAPNAADLTPKRK